MDKYLGFVIAGAAVSSGLTLIGVTSWIERRQQHRLLPFLVPTTSLMLLGLLILLAALVYSVSLLQTGHNGYLIGVAALSFGLIVIGCTSLIERHRQHNSTGYRSSTTPIMLFGGIVVVGAIAFILSVWRK